jgi:hypothetical protein
MQTRFRGSRRLPSGKSRSSALAGTRLERRSRWPAGAAAARVHRCSKTSTRPSNRRFHGILLAACASTTSAESMFQRALPWTARTSRHRRTVVGTAAFGDRSSPLDRQPPKVLRVRGRGSPSLGAPSRDCSRERLRPNPDRFRHLVSRSLSVALPGGGAGDGRSRRRGAR